MGERRSINATASAAPCSRSPSTLFNGKASASHSAHRRRTSLNRKRGTGAWASPTAAFSLDSMKAEWTKYSFESLSDAVA
jgi:hypothetical protein